MNQWIILVLLIVLCNISLLAQGKYDMINRLNIGKDIKHLERKIKKDIKEHPILSERKDLQLYHIFWLQSDCLLAKEEYSDCSFLSKVYPLYRSSYSKILSIKTGKYLQNFATFVCDSTGAIIATASSRILHVASCYDEEDIELARILYHNEMDFIFYLSGTFVGTYFGIKGDNVYVISRESMDQLKKHPLGEFLGCCYDEFLVSPAFKPPLR